MGTLVSALGVYFSVWLDLPTGATIVCTFGAVLPLVFLLHVLFFHGPRARPLKGARSARDLDALDNRTTTETRPARPVGVIRPSS